MKRHLCILTSDQSVVDKLSETLGPLGIEFEHFAPSEVIDGKLNYPAKVTLIDLEALDNVSQENWGNLRRSLKTTLCVPLTAESNDSVFRTWFGDPLKTLTKPLTSAQIRWLVFMCIKRSKDTANEAVSTSKTASASSENRRLVLPTLTTVLKHQHPEKAANQIRVANLVQKIGHHCRIDPSIGQAIVSCAGLYDLGVLAERSLQKFSARKNTRARRAFYSAALAKFSGASPDIVAILRHLDENWDGSGVPAGKKGSEIPIGARMLRIAIDFIRLQYDSERQLYLSVGESAAWLRDAGGTLYDPELIPRFLECVLANEDQNLHQNLWICGARNLLPGMRLTDNLYGREGLMLLSKRKVLTEHLISLLIQYEERFNVRDGLFIGVEVERELHEQVM